MNKAPTQPLITGNAYKIFLSELTRQVSQAKGVLGNDLSSATEADLSSLGITSHTIKGGAGFLGFPELATCAGRLEHLCRKSHLSSLDKLTQARVLIQELEQLAKLLPEPGQES